MLNEARIGPRKARANENLTPVARGAALADDGRSDRYATEYATATAGLDRALTRAWRTDRAGDHDGVLRQVTGGEASTGAAFDRVDRVDRVDRALRKAVDHEQDGFVRAAGRARDAWRV